MYRVISWCVPERWLDKKNDVCPVQWGKQDHDQLDKCQKFMSFRGGVILYRVQSFLSPPNRLEF